MQDNNSIIVTSNHCFQNTASLVPRWTIETNASTNDINTFLIIRKLPNIIAAQQPFIKNIKYIYKHLQLQFIISRTIALNSE